MKEDKYCPKCGKKLSLFYMKQNCPACGTDMLRYDVEGRLERDAEKAAKEVEDLWRFLRKVDKARLIEKHYRKRGKVLPWEEAPAEDPVDHIEREEKDE